MSELALILGLSGAVLTPDERALLAEARPWGIILFRRNCESRIQLRALTDSLRDLLGRDDLPILIDQEGGRVARLAEPEWRRPPAQTVFGGLFAGDPEAAREAAFLNARLIAHDLRETGVNVNCAPMIDLRAAGSHPFIVERAFASEPHEVVELARAVCDGLLDGGVLPVVKHAPGHGRASADSHESLPRVDAPREELGRSDFVPFRALADAPMAMTAHIVYSAFDPQRPATLSSKVIHGVIRGEIGFDGLLMSDDLGMGALSGDLRERVRHALVAGCDVALQCSGVLEDMKDAAEGARPLQGDSARRAASALARLKPPADFDPERAATRLARILATGTLAA